MKELFENSPSEMLMKSLSIRAVVNKFRVEEKIVMFVCLRPQMFKNICINWEPDT